VKGWADTLKNLLNDNSLSIAEKQTLELNFIISQGTQKKSITILKLGDIFKDQDGKDLHYDAIVSPANSFGFM
jgi:dsDNA-binding SOS-regulon protein